MRSKKNKKKLMIAIALGLVATIGVFSMVNGQKAQVAQLSQQLAAQQAAANTNTAPQPPPVPQVETTNVILATTDIKSGDIITIKKIKKKEYKKSELPPDFFFNENFVLGKIASQDILAGKIINNEDILSSSQNSFNIPPGMRAITIPNSAIQGLASYIYVGSKIDLITVKSPPEFIAQNIKIIAFESDLNVQEANTPAVPTQVAPPRPAQPGQPTTAAPNLTAPPAQPPQPVTATTRNIPSNSPAYTRAKISADKATGITVLVPASTANKLITAMIAGKIQIIMRGNNDDKIIRQASSSSGNITQLKTGSVLPPPPSGTGKLPSLPGVPSSIAPPVIEKPKVEVEIITGSSKAKQTFDDPNNSSASIPSKNLKELFKLSN